MNREEAIYCLKAQSEQHSEVCEECPLYGQTGVDHCCEDALQMAITALQNQPVWIPVSERLPHPEDEVLVTAIRRYVDGDCRYIVIPAIYEDGTVLECDSNWNWEDIDGDWDEENDCLIIPEGWFEDRKYNPDCTYNCAIDDEVVAWMPLPEPYRESEENNG